MTRVVMLLAMLGGCSLALQAPYAKPSMGYADQASTCSPSNKYWIADALIAGLGGAAVIGGRVLADEETKDDTAAYTIAGMGAFVSLVYLASAGNGRTWARECRAAKEAALLTASR